MSIRIALLIWISIYMRVFVTAVTVPTKRFANTKSFLFVVSLFCSFQKPWLNLEWKKISQCLCKFIAQNGFCSQIFECEAPEQCRLNRVPFERKNKSHSLRMSSQKMFDDGSKRTNRNIRINEWNELQFFAHWLRLCVYRLLFIVATSRHHKSADCFASDTRRKSQSK